MKALYFAPYSPEPACSGAALRVNALWKAIRSAAELQVCVLGEYPSYVVRQNLKMQGVDFMPSKMESDSQRYLRCLKAALRMRSIPAQRYLSPKRKAKIRERIADMSPDVVILGDTFMSELGLIVNRMGKRLVIDAQNVESRLYLGLARAGASLSARVGNMILGINCLAIERQLHRICDQLWAASEEDARYYAKAGIRDVRVVPNVIDLDRYRCDKKEESRSVVFTGTYSFEPTEQAALMLINISKKILPCADHHLYLVGKNPTERMISRSRGCEHIRITGMVEDVAPYISAASVVAAPIISGSGTKYKVLEAMAMGKAVLTTPAGALGLEIKNGACAMISDIEEFPGQLIRLLGDTQGRLALGAAAKKHVETKFSLETLCRLMEGFFSD